MDELLPPKRLALAHAPRDFRAAFSLLLQFDDRLGVIIAKGGEAVIGQMRMAWWRDVMEKSPEQRPKGEPLVQQLNQIQQEGKFPNITGRLLSCIDGWDRLLAHEEWSNDILQEHAKHRALAIFGDDHMTAQQWALHDLSATIGLDVSAVYGNLPSPAKRVKWPRHLSILAMAADQQHKGGGAMSGLRLMLHALTGL